MGAFAGGFDATLLKNDPGGRAALQREVKLFHIFIQEYKG